MKVIIIEDEINTGKNLKKRIEVISEDVEILNIIPSVQKGIDWFSNNPHPDLIFADIQLSDGLSFEIFEEVDITSPIIFTTAYDEYAVDAFQVNSIDYLLKPISNEKLKQSMLKYQDLHSAFTKLDKPLLSSIQTDMKLDPQLYKSRFLIKRGTIFKSIPCTDIVCFFVDNQIAHILDKRGNKYVVDNSLDDLMKSLDPHVFFRVNRQCVISIHFIDSVHPFFNNRLHVKLSQETSEDIIVSRRKSLEFKEWLDR